MVELKHRFGQALLVIGSGTLSDGVSSLVSIVVPVAIAIWIMTGKRKLVIDENIERLLG